VFGIKLQTPLRMTSLLPIVVVPNYGLIAGVGDDVFEGLVGEVAAELLGGEAEGAVDELRGGAADVGCDEAIGRGP
jgi:hypothetical protein